MQTKIQIYSYVFFVLAAKNLRFYEKKADLARNFNVLFVTKHV